MCSSDLGAPHVTLGPFEETYLRLRPLATVLFVGVGLGAALLRLWHTLTGMAQAAQSGATGGGPSASSLVGSILSIVILVALSVFLLWNWVDVVNGAIDMFWGLTQDTNLNAPVEASPAPSVTPAP